MSEDLMAAIDVMAYGYEVTIAINGIDICLKTGENELKIDCRRMEGEDSTGLTIEIKSEAQFANNENVFFYREEPDNGTAEKSIEETFSL